MNVLSLLIAMIAFIIPAYFGNMAPVFVGGGPPMDGGRVWKDGRRILGSGKTWRGFFGGIAVAAVAGMFISLAGFYDENFAEEALLYGLLKSPAMLEPVTLGVFLGFLQGLGALVGDAIGSFIKRRRNIERGGPLWGLDQLGFVILAMTFAYPFYAWPLEYVLLIPVTFFVHLGANATGYILGLKDVPW
ncbi:MAG: CDP-2,3-bis-(O-geranylgeranyl)-sn-glycerol synthase [Candidatus Heimdallarchaeota archaeon]